MARRAALLLVLLSAALASGCGKSEEKAKKGKASPQAPSVAPSTASPASQASKAPASAAPAAPAAPSGAKAVASSMNSLDAVRIGVASVQGTPSFDPAAYPLITRFQDPRLAAPVKVASPDGKWLVWRDKDASGYHLYLSKADGSGAEKLKACKNGYQPSFSPDGKRLLFTAMNWATEQRSIYVYDIASRKLQKSFTAALKLPRNQGLGGLAAWSADGSKIIFTYFDDLWMMNANGIGRRILNLAEPLKKPVVEAALLAWNKTGDALVYQARGDASMTIVRLTNRI